MKYDRPVWQLMHACADALPETFRLEDVRAWFAKNFPEVSDATIRAHVVGLTDGGAKHPQFQRRSPLFRRVSRGVYAPIPFEERGELPEDDPEDAAASAIRFQVKGPCANEMVPVEAVQEDTAQDDPAQDDPAHDDPAQDDTAQEESVQEETVQDQTVQDDPGRRPAEASPSRAGAPFGADGDDDGLTVSLAWHISDDELARVVDLGPQDVTASQFWPFPVDKRPSEDPMAKAAEARLKKREKDDRRRRKALKREAEQARLETERIESQRLATERAAAAARLQADAVEAEQEAARERKRVSKLRKAARKERDRAEKLEREEDERRAQRDVERKARDSAERDRLEFERAERERRVFEEDSAREQREREQLEREDQQLRMSLRPMVDPAPEATAVDSAPEATARPQQAAVPAEPESLVPKSLAPERSAIDDFSSPGGIVIVRAPRAQAGESADSSASSSQPEVQAESGQPVDSETQSPPFEVDSEDGRARDAIVLGSVGPRLAVPAPARDAFRDIAFQRARRDAELSGSRWFVLSAEHGLLEPQEWMSPDERAMSDIEPRHRAAWATWVVARLETLVGELPGLVIQVSAPGSIATPVLAALEAAGAETTVGPIAPADAEDHESMDEMSHAEDASHDEAAVEGPADDDAAGDEKLDELDVDELGDDDVVTQPGAQQIVDERPDAQVIPFVRASSVAEHLADPRQSIPAAAAAALPQHPGIYAWSVDHAGSRDLNRALRLPVRAGVIYVGQVGSASGLPGSSSSIQDHVTRVQLHGRARSSTFRRTLATSLSTLLGLHTIDDPRLNEWMIQHLTIAAWPTEETSRLQELTSSVVDELLPVLNVDRRHSSEYRDRLAELGGRLA